MSEKATYHHGNLRAALLGAAFEILLESGVEGLSLRSVARRAGVSPGAPYHHFRDKQAILAELADDRRGRANDAFTRAMAGRTTPEEKLKALGVAYVRYALEHPAEFKLMFGGSLQTEVSGYALKDAPIFKLFRRSVQAVSSQLSADELDTAAVTAWSLVHGLAQLSVNGPLGAGKEPEQIAALGEQIALVVARYAVRHSSTPSAELS